jgi:electron transfer flavoprotein alpha/beta subunit
MMKAKKKPVETLDVAMLGVDVTPRLKAQSYRVPKTEKFNVTASSNLVWAIHLLTVASLSCKVYPAASAA